MGSMGRECREGREGKDMDTSCDIFSNDIFGGHDVLRFSTIEVRCDEIDVTTCMHLVGWGLVCLHSPSNATLCNARRLMIDKVDGHYREVSTSSAYFVYMTARAT